MDKKGVSGENELPIVDIDESVEPSGENELPFIDYEDEEFFGPSVEEPVYESKLNIEDVEPEELEEIESEEEEEEPEEFFLEEDEIEVIEDIEGLPSVLVEEYKLPEYKIIATQEEQEKDLIEDYIRKLPEKKKTQQKYLDEIFKKVEHFAKLKDMYSEKVDENIVGPKLKTEAFRPILQEIFEGTFDNEVVVPIVSGQKILYEHEPTSEKEELLFSSSDINDTTNIIITNGSKIQEQSDIRRKYKKGPSRFNYSLQNEVQETLMTAKSTLFSKDTNGYPLEIKDRTHAFVNLLLQGEENTTKYLGSVNGNVSLRSGAYTNETLFGDKEQVLGNDKVILEGIATKSPESETKLFHNTLFDVIENKNYSDTFSNVQENTEIEFKNLETDDKVNTEEVPGEVPGEVPEESETSTKKNKFSVNIPNTEVRTKQEMTNYLNSSIPSHKRILEIYYESIKNSLSFEEIDNVLRPYHSSKDHLVTEDIGFIRQLIHKNNDIKLKEYQANKVTKQDIKDITEKPNVHLLNKTLLDKFKPFYGEYPYFNTAQDSDISRLKWIQSRHDQGMLFYKTITLDMSVKFFRSLIEKEYELKGKEEVHRIQIERFETVILPTIERDLLKQNGLECPKKRIVKIYYSEGDLEAHQNRSILIDEDLLHHDETKESVVQLGQYALLQQDNITYVYERSDINGQHMWIKTEDVDGGHLLQSNKDFCNNQGKVIESVNVLKLGDTSSCIYSELLQSCIGKSYYKDILEYETQKQSHNRIKLLLEQITNSYSIVDTLDAEIVQLENLASLTLQQIYKKHEKVDIEDIKEKEKDLVLEQYGALYSKIDAYMKKINKLPTQEMYPLMMKLYSMYGRNPTSKENPKNVYCKAGPKVLFCKHHLDLASYYENESLREKQTILTHILENYGIESEGVYYCNNCGQEIYVGDYETVEGFLETGAHNVTTEELPSESEKDKNTRENDPLASTLLGFLQEENNSDYLKENVIDVQQIISTLLTIYGIVLKETELLQLFKVCASLVKKHVKTQTQWWNSLPKKPKTTNKVQIKKVYDIYKKKESILYVSAQTLLFLQLLIPSITITKGHKTVELSLEGEPLVRGNKKGIKSMEGVLRSLSVSGSDFWAVLTKGTGKLQKFESIVMSLANETNNQVKISEKLEYLQDKKEIFESGVINVWNEFKPPLQPFEIKLDSFDKSSGMSREEYAYLVALKAIEVADKIVSTSDIVNPLFDPTPLGNSCCLQKLGKDFHIRDYFDREGEKIVSKAVHALEKQYPPKRGILENKSTFVFKDKYLLTQLEQFGKIIRSDEIKEDEKMEFIVNTVSDINSSYFGQKHIYDKEGVCVLTGVRRADKQMMNLSDEEYIQFITEIYKKNRFSSSENKEAFLPPPKDIVEKLLENNHILRNDKLLNTIIKDKMVQFDKLNGLIEVEISQIGEIFKQSLSSSKTKALEKILQTLGDFTKLHKEDIDLYGEDVADYNKYTRGIQYIRNIINTQVPVFIGYIGNIEQMLQEEDNEGKQDETRQFKELAKFVESDKYSKDIFHFLKQLHFFGDDLNLIHGTLSRYNCFHDVVKKSNFLPKDAFLLVKYVFVIYIRSFLHNVNVNAEDIVLPDVVEPSFSETSLPEDTIPFGKEGVSTLVEGRTSYMISIVEYILEQAQKNEELLDKHTKLYMNETIQRLADKAKEENLKLMKQLDKEARQSTKLMIGLGMEFFSNLAQRRNFLVIGEEMEPQVDVEEQVETTDILENNIDDKIRSIYGNVGEDQIDSLRDEYALQMRTEREIYEERDILPDDE